MRTGLGSFWDYPIPHQVSHCAQPHPISGKVESHWCTLALFRSTPSRGAMAFTGYPEVLWARRYRVVGVEQEPPFRDQALVGLYFALPDISLI